MPADGDVTFEVSNAELQRFAGTLIRYMAEFGIDAQKIMRQQARLICVNLAHNTQPYGLDAAAREQGRRAVLRDIGKVYRSIDTVYASIKQDSEEQARAFYGAAMKGDLATAKHILKGTGLDNLMGADIGLFDESLHESLRNRRGRITIRNPRRIVVDPRNLVKYQKKMADRVGWAKSSWASCAEQIGGTRGIPYWAKKLRGPGTVEDASGNPNDPRIVLTSNVPYMPTVLPDAERRAAVEIQRRKMENALKAALNGAARRAKLAA